MADAFDTPSLSDPHPEQCEHPAAPERDEDAIVLQAWDWWLAARRARCSIPDHLSNAEVDELASAYCDVWDAADVVACATPARTPEGMAAKLRMAFGYMVQSADGEEAFLGSGGTNLEPDKKLEWPAQMLASVIRDLERMATDAELVRLGEGLLAAWRAERDAVRATGDDDDITDLCRPVEALIERILKVQARAFAGIGVKAVAYAMIVDQPEESDTFDGRLYRGIHHDACALWEPQP